MRSAPAVIRTWLLMTFIAFGQMSDSMPGNSTAVVLHAADATATSVPANRGAGDVNVAFRNVNLHVDDAIVVEIRRVDGALVRTRADQPPIFDDQRSFSLRIDAGEVAISAANVTRLLNKYVFAYDGSPLEDVEVTIVNGQLRQKGTLRKGIKVPFSMVADVSATSDGRLRLHPTSVKAGGIPTARLMKILGLELDEVIKLRAPGVALDDNDFLLDLGRLLPAPKIMGRLTGARLTADRLVQVYGSPNRAKTLVPPDARARNFMYYRGGTLRFGKLTMSDADMQLIDADASDVFDFHPAKYLKQLVAGYSKNTPAGGLKVYMPDYDQTRGADLKPGPGS